jgi:nucleoside-diphosphate-sugar epimerase
MRVFVTGASGHIGSAVVPELLRAGHEVVGLARSDTAAATLRQAGAQVRRGSLDEVDTLRSAAAEADGVIHLAYMHDAPAHVDAAAADRRAIEVIGAAMEGTGKPFVGTSGTLVLAPGRVGTEQDPPDPRAPAAPRNAAENTAIALAERGIRSSVVRLAPTVHSSLDHVGFIPALIGIAREKRAAAFVGDGTNRWPAVHTLDAACLYRLAWETAAAGTRWHGADDEGVPFREIAEAIGRHLGVPVVSIPPEAAGAHFGWLSFAVTADNPTSAALTRRHLGWQPTHPRLLPDLEAGHYFG